MFVMSGLEDPFHLKVLILFTSKPWESVVVDPRVLLGSPCLYPIGYLGYPEAMLACEPNGLCHWLTNQVYIEGATPELVLQLSELPTVARVEKEEIFKIIQPVTIKYPAPGASASLQMVEWGVTKINAPDAWRAGFNGMGVVVGNIDTGVRHTHTALASSYHADSYSWYDPVKKSKTPTDGNGHGTHTMGTMVGSGGIGVAPGAKWIACRGCGTLSCPSSALLACLQWMYCPTSGNTKD
jgi:hypothetical protein